MSLLVVFGLPGAGKTYAGAVLVRHFRYFLFDGDDEIPARMRGALSRQELITEDMRDEFLGNIIRQLHKYRKQYKNIVLTQTLIKEWMRERIRDAFSESQFVLISTDKTIREKRLRARQEYPLDIAYARKMVENFEKPRVDHTIINNNQEGEEMLMVELQALASRK